ncbi:hypothetical protein Gotur_014945 [Gossypium turneri]
MMKSNSCFTVIMVICPISLTSRWINLIGGSHLSQQFWPRHSDL